MKQRHTITFSILLLIQAVLGQYTLAEIAIKDKSEIVGTWLLEATAIRQEGEKTPEQGRWVFGNDGILTTTSFYKFSGQSGQSSTLTEKYEIKEGEIAAERSGRFNLIERQGNQMILKGPFGYYFFKKE
jgi:hypothetical protein